MIKDRDCIESDLKNIKYFFITVGFFKLIVECI